MRSQDIMKVMVLPIMNFFKLTLFVSVKHSMTLIRVPVYEIDAIHDISLFVVSNGDLEERNVDVVDSVYPTLQP